MPIAQTNRAAVFAASSAASRVAANAPARVGAAAPARANDTGQSALGSGGGIAQNFDQFLMLLTTQLKNQNPLEPLNTNEFTQQLVQFASVEQQLKQNATLQALLVSTQSSAASTVASFIGMTIRAEGATAPLVDNKAIWSLNAPRASTGATITIRDSLGNVVATKTMPLKAGDQTFTWDGKTAAGGLAPKGDYTLTVTANDVAGQPMTVSTQIEGRVDGADLTGDMPVLLVGSVRVPLSNVRSINRPTE